MNRSGRLEIGSILGTVAASIGTFVGITWLCFLAGAVLVRLLDVPLAELPDQAVVLLLVVIALGVAGWLEDGGFERLGANPDGGSRFAWLAIIYLPLAFSPLWVAVRLLAGPAEPLGGAFVFGVAVLAGWLAFYGGLERLGLEPADFGRAVVAAVGLVAVPVAAVVLFDVAWLAETRVAVVTALVVQCLALWLGLTRNANPG